MLWDRKGRDVSYDDRKDQAAKQLAERLVFSLTAILRAVRLMSYISCIGMHEGHEIPVAHRDSPCNRMYEILQESPAVTKG